MLILNDEPATVIFREKTENVRKKIDNTDERS